MSEKGLGRGLEHLIEQNATELGFLDAYGPKDEDPEAVFDEVVSVLRVLNPVLKKDVATINGVEVAVSNGVCTVRWSGASLPLVRSDLQQPGMRSGHLDHDRSNAVVELVGWTMEVRRLLGRLVEHELSLAA